MDQRAMVALRIVQKDQLPVAGDVVGNAARGLKLADVPALETPDQRRKHFLKVVMLSPNLVMLSPNLVMLSLSKHGRERKVHKNEAFPERDRSCLERIFGPIKTRHFRHISRDF